MSSVYNMGFQPANIVGALCLIRPANVGSVNGFVMGFPHKILFTSYLRLHQSELNISFSDFAKTKNWEYVEQILHLGGNVALTKKIAIVKYIFAVGVFFASILFAPDEVV